MMVSEVMEDETSMKDAGIERLGSSLGLCVWVGLNREAMCETWNIEHFFLMILMVILVVASQILTLDS